MNQTNKSAAGVPRGTCNDRNFAVARFSISDSLVFTGEIFCTKGFSALNIRRPRANLVLNNHNHKR
jgi:hypothetical protein